MEKNVSTTDRDGRRIRQRGCWGIRLDISVVQKDALKLAEPPSQMLHQFIDLTAEVVEESIGNDIPPRSF